VHARFSSAYLLLVRWRGQTSAISKRAEANTCNAMPNLTRILLLSGSHATLSLLAFLAAWAAFAAHCTNLFIFLTPYTLKPLNLETLNPVTLKWRLSTCLCATAPVAFKSVYACMRDEGTRLWLV
jgi:hypothetical protein